MGGDKCVFKDAQCEIDYQHDDVFSLRGDIERSGREFSLERPIKGTFYTNYFRAIHKKSFTRKHLPLFFLCMRYTVVMAIDVIPVIMYNSESLNKKKIATTTSFPIRFPLP